MSSPAGAPPSKTTSAGRRPRRGSSPGTATGSPAPGTSHRPAPDRGRSAAGQGPQVAEDPRERDQRGVDVGVGGGPADGEAQAAVGVDAHGDRKSTRLNSSH